MTRHALILILLAGCAELDADIADLDLSETEAASTTSQGSSYQGSSYQGSSYQGSSYQGSSYQGSSYQGSSYQGASYAGYGVTGSVPTKTTIELWRRLKTGYWEQRRPTYTCIWNPARTATTSCTSVNLATQLSPLAGATFATTFIDPTTGTARAGKVRIASFVGSVKQDTTLAMHPLKGAMLAPAITPPNGTTCTHPDGCGKNNDLFLYQVELVDTNGAAYKFCPDGGQAFALRDLWDQTGKRVASDTQFTFACTRGTIAKCMRWGYRPFGYAQKNNGQSVSMPDYHQSCVRAAAADYCANGTSFTKDGTLIDIYDYQPHQPYATGLIPRTLSQAMWSTTFVWESSFDRKGGRELDFVRYQEVGNLESACPGMFSLGTAPVPGQYHIVASRGPSSYVWPAVSVDSTSICSHSEESLGRWLHPNCSKCTYSMWEKYGDISCLQSTGAWTEQCRKLSRDFCTEPVDQAKMAIHSECTTGGPLQIYDSACTLNLCGDPQYASCCTSGWTSACTAAANARCTGGLEDTGIISAVGFCGQALPLVFN